MDFEHGILFFFIGAIITVVGFFIAFKVAVHYHKKENKKNRPLSSVEQSLKNLRSVNGWKGDDCQ
tara:strand:- start:60 stop:254 length:195 start_codon:yes stop_codon:yes gene_type:complete